MDSGAPGLHGQIVPVHFVMIPDYQRDIELVLILDPHLAGVDALVNRNCTGVAIIQIVVCIDLHPID